MYGRARKWHLPYWTDQHSRIRLAPSAAVVDRTPRDLKGADDERHCFFLPEVEQSLPCPLQSSTSPITGAQKRSTNYCVTRRPLAPSLTSTARRRASAPRGRASANFRPRHSRSESEGITSPRVSPS